MAGEVLFVGTAAGLAVYLAGPERGAWRCERRALAGHAVHALVAADAETLLASVAGLGPQQSFDGGVTWLPAPGAAVEPVGLRAATAAGAEELAYPRLRGATAYARLGGRPAALIGAGADGAMLFRSEDEGIHWQPAAMPPEPVGRVASIVPAAARRTSAWAGTADGAILRSDDDGRSWRVVAREPAAVLCLAASGA